jgi:hypothetical protein
MEADRSLEDLDAGPPTVQTHEAAVAGFAAASSAQRMAALEKAYVAKREGGLVRRLIAGRKVDPIHQIIESFGLSPGTKIRDLTYEQRGVLSRLTRAARTPGAVDL